MHEEPAEQANPRVAVIIPAKDEAERIGATVRAVKALPFVDLELIVVVDDGSSDDTQDVARQAGAVTVRHTVNRGKASSMETGAKVVAMRAVKGEAPPLLLFLDADLGETAAEAAPLIEPVIKGEADFTIAVLPRPTGAGGHGFVLGLSRWAIRRTTGWNPLAPLSGQRCLNTAAFQAALPLAAGWGVETDMTISLLSKGFAVKEVPVNFKHRVSRHDFASQMHRLHQFIDVVKAISKLRARGVHIKKHKFSKVASKQKPVLQADFQASAYHVNSFIPLLGQQNLVEPVNYGDYRVAAGITGSGSAVIMQQAEDGTSAWSVDLGAPLVACSQQAIGDSEEENRFLPCLYQSGNGSGVAIVDLKMGTANWVWESADPYVNIGTTDSQIVLVGEDLSLLRISQTGEQLSEGLVSQKASDTQFQPDLAACSLDDQPTAQAPEKFELFSDSLWIIGHNGVNYLINPETNQIQVASPGRLIRNSDDTAWALSTDDGCVRSFYIQPQRAHIAPLPKGTTVPTDNTGHLLNMVQNGGKLFQMDWDTSRSLRAVFSESDFKLGKDTQILPTKKFLYIASGGHLGCYSRQDGKRLWEFSENLDTLRLHQDILLYTTDQGELKAVSSADGITLWSLSDSAGVDFAAIRKDKQLRTFSPQAFKAWGRQSEENPGVAKGVANPMNKAKPGLNFPVDSCIRVRDVSGSGSSYQVQFDRVSCELKGAEKIIRVVDTGEVERGKPAKDYMSKCLKDPAATSAITVTSAIADPKISALCTGKAENAQEEPSERDGQPKTDTTHDSER